MSLENRWDLGVGDDSEVGLVSHEKGNRIGQPETGLF